MATPTQAITSHSNPLDIMRQAQKQALSGGAKSYILRPKDGESIRLHILQEMTSGTVIYMHRLADIPYKAICGNELGVPCDYCARAKAGEWKLQAAPFMYLPCAVAVEDESGKKSIGVRLLELYAGKNTLFAKLEKFFSDNGTVCSHDFAYSRKGSGQKDTTYEITVQLSASIFKPAVLTQAASSMTPDRIRERVAEAFPPAISGEDEVGNATVVESNVVEGSSSDEYIPEF